MARKKASFFAAVKAVKRAYDVGQAVGTARSATKRKGAR